MSLRATTRPTPPTRSRLAAPAAGLAAALLLVGCGVGQKSQTYQEKAVADATNDAVGSIAVRNLAIKAPQDGILLRQGTDAPVIITLVNNGGDDDTLTAVTSPAAASVEIVGPRPTIEVPRLRSADAAYSLLLRGLTRDLPTGSYVEMTLTFTRNGSKTVLVPVQTDPSVERAGGDYKVAETDSAGKPIGDNVPQTGSDPKGDQGNITPSSG